MNKFILTFGVYLFALSQTLFAQNIGIGTTAPDSSALLDLTSADKGVLVPRMSASARQAIVNPAVGLMVFDSTNNAFYYFTGNGWLELLAGSVDHISDADGDTKIQVEESPDENVIRFEVAGSEFVSLDGTRINVNTTNSNLLLGEQVSDSVTGSNNTLLGVEAGQAMTSGSYNTALGWQTLKNTTTTHQNVAIGARSMASNTGGGDIVAIGYSTSEVNSTGKKNIAIGSYAGQYNTTGEGNVSIGYNTLYKNETGGYNTAVGYNIYGPSTNMGEYNTFVGSGIHPMTSNLLNATGIGANTIVEQDSSLILGNAAKVGIGTSVPDEMLHVVGNIKMEDGNESGGYVLTSDSSGVGSWQQPAVPSLLQDANMDTKVQVEKYADENQIRFDVGGQEAMRINSNGQVTMTGLTHTQLFLTKTDSAYASQIVFSGSGPQYQFGTPAGSDRLRIYNGAAGEEVMSFDTTGNVGIGVAYPLEKLHVDGRIMATDTTRSGLVLRSGDNLQDMGIAFRNVGSSYTWSMFRTDAGSNNADLVIAGGNTSSDPADLNERMRITKDGNVGIGTPDPTEKLHVVGNLRMEDGNEQSGYVLTSDTAGVASWQVPAVQALIEDADGNTGVDVEGTGDENQISFYADSIHLLSMRTDTNGNVFMDIDGSMSNKYNTIIGNSAGDDLTTASENVFVGLNSGTQVTTANFNTLLGANAGGILKTGGANTFIGQLAGSGNLFGSGNTCIGKSAGFTNGGSNNTFIGASSGTTGSGSGNVCIGNAAGAGNTVSNKLFIHNDSGDSTVALIYGEFDNAWLKVNGRLSPRDGLTDIDGDTKMQLEETPDEDVIRFDVKGTEVATMSDTLATIKGTGRGLLTIKTLDNTMQTGLAFQNSGSYYTWSIHRDTATTTDLIISGGNAGPEIDSLAERMRITSDGDVGIGTSSPGAALDVNGDFKLGASGDVLNSIVKHTVSKDVSPLSQNAGTFVTFSVPGAMPGGSVFISPGQDLPGSAFIAEARVLSNGSVSVKFMATDGTLPDPPNMNYFITVIN